MGEETNFEEEAKLNILKEAKDILEDNKKIILNSKKPIEVIDKLLVQQEAYTQTYARSIFKKFAIKYNIPKKLRKSNKPAKKRTTIKSILDKNRGSLVQSRYPASKASRILVLDLKYSFYYAKNIFKKWALENKIKHNIDNF